MSRKSKHGRKFIGDLNQLASNSMQVSLILLNYRLCLVLLTIQNHNLPLLTSLSAFAHSYDVTTIITILVSSFNEQYTS